MVGNPSYMNAKPSLRSIMTLLSAGDTRILVSRSGRDLDSADLEETAELGPGAKNVLDLKLQGMEEGAMRLEQEAGARLWKTTIDIIFSPCQE